MSLRDGDAVEVNGKRYHCYASYLGLEAYEPAATRPFFRIRGDLDRMGDEEIERKLVDFAVAVVAEAHGVGMDEVKRAIGWEE